MLACHGTGQEQEQRLAGHAARVSMANQIAPSRRETEPGTRQAGTEPQTHKKKKSLADRDAGSQKNKKSTTAKRYSDLRHQYRGLKTC
jgi:hypothetical protein